MKKVIIALSLVGILSACNFTISDKETDVGALKNSHTFAFSNKVKLDTFTVAIVGNHTKDMQLLFTIKSFEGKEIYRQEIKTSELLKNYLATADMTKESDKIKFLKEEISYFFEDHHFLEPAVTADEQHDRIVPDQAFYHELKQNGLNGFDYRLGKDQNVYIAWSEKEKKVKVYYKCC